MIACEIGCAGVTEAESATGGAEPGGACRSRPAALTCGPMADMGAPLDRYREVETGAPFTPQNPRLLKIELSETSVMARNGSMVAYQGDVHFEHKGGGLGRLLKKAATGEGLRLMQATGSGELFLANLAMLVHVLRLDDDSLSVNGANILAFEAGIDWDVTRVKGGTAGMLAGGLFNIHLRGSGLVALVSDGEPLRLDVSEAPTFADPQAAIAWSAASRRTSRPTCRPSR